MIAETNPYQTPATESAVSGSGFPWRATGFHLTSVGCFVLVASAIHGSFDVPMITFIFLAAPFVLALVSVLPTLPFGESTFKQRTWSWIRVMSVLLGLFVLLLSFDYAHGFPDFLNGLTRTNQGPNVVFTLALVLSVLIAVVVWLAASFFLVKWRGVVHADSQRAIRTSIDSNSARE